MKVVIDTNILVQSLSRKSPNNWVIKEFINGNFQLFASVEIIHEYEEIVGEKIGLFAAKNFLSLLAESHNFFLKEVYFKWNLISIDPDDNKFVDLAVSASIDFIVTEDKHFNVLQAINFPPVKVIGLKEFKTLLNLI